MDCIDLTLIFFGFGASLSSAGLFVPRISSVSTSISFSMAVMDNDYLGLQVASCEWATGSRIFGDNTSPFNMHSNNVNYFQIKAKIDVQYTSFDGEFSVLKYGELENSILVNGAIHAKSQS